MEKYLSSSCRRAIDSYRCMAEGTGTRTSADLVIMGNFEQKMNKLHLTALTCSFILISHVGCITQQCEDFIRSHDTNTSFSGIVVDNYMDENDRGIPTFILSNGVELQTDTHTMCCFAQPGDSIWKRKGSLKYYLKRKDSVIIFYPDCGNITVKDTGTEFNDAFQSDCGKRRQTKKFPIEIKL